MSLRKISFKEPTILENGSLLSETEAAFHTFGNLNADKSNVVWVCHALTANSDVLDWWSGLFGENDLFNPKDYFIICANVLGSHYGSTSPLSINPLTNLPYFHDFPRFTIRDIVNQHIKLANYLGIEQIHTLIGGSLGGQQCLEWAIMEPNRIENLILVATNAVHSSWGVAFNESQRLAIENDISWAEKNESAGIQGMKIARSIALLSYRTAEIYNLSQKNPLDSKTYQTYQGDKLAKRFNAFSYWHLSHAMDSHNVGRNRNSVEEALKVIRANTLIISIEGDILFPPSDQEVIFKGIQNATKIMVPSKYGHDGFLIETQRISHEIDFFLHKSNVKVS